jgi:predicted permease
MNWLRDVKYAVRTLYRAKGMSAAAILILAGGIGANTAVFTFLDRLLFRPLPVPKPSQLVLISNSALGGRGQRTGNRSFSYDAYVYLRDRNQALAGLAAESYMAPRERRKGRKIERPAEAESVSGNFFEVLGEPPLLGRTLAPADDVRSGASHVAVASYRFWSRRYNLAADVLGRTVYLNDVPFTIIGVMPAGFFGTHRGYDPDLYVPAGSLPELFGSYAIDSMGLIGRLLPGVSPPNAQSNLQVLWNQFPAAGRAVPGGRIECQDGSSGYAGTGGEKQRSLELLAAIVALLLLVGCANVGCLLMARGAARQHEMAIRLSLGAGTARVLRQTSIESCLLALGGGAAGLLVALWADRLLLIAFQWKDRPIDLSPDWRVLAFGLGLSLVTGLLFGLAPALQFLRGGPVALTQERTVAPRFASGRALVIVEVALSLTLVTGAAVFLRSFQNLSSVPTGFVADHVSVIGLAAAEESVSRGAPFREAARLADSLHGAPGIESAALADFTTFNDAYVQTTLKAAGNADAPGRRTHILLVDGNYFAALRIPPIAGRTFTPRDDERAPKVAVLAEGTARRLFPGQSPIGRSILLGSAAMHPKPGQETEIVGVVGDIKFTSLADAAPDLVFQPVLQGESHTSVVKLQVRSRMEPGNVAALVRSRIRDGHLPLSVESATALEDQIGASLLNDRLRMQASSLFGALALLLIAAGIYGLMAYAVVRRTREIGIRMAVGSSSAGILRLVLNDSLRLVLCGVILGLPGSLAVMKVASSMVFGLPPVDLASLGIAALVLTATAIVASTAPAWRAAHLDPVEALRVQ